MNKIFVLLFVLFRNGYALNNWGTNVSIETPCLVGFFEKNSQFKKHSTPLLRITTLISLSTHYLYLQSFLSFLYLSPIITPILTISLFLSPLIPPKNKPNFFSNHHPNKAYDTQDMEWGGEKKRKGRIWKPTYIFTYLSSHFDFLPFFTYINKKKNFF